MFIFNKSAYEILKQRVDGNNPKMLYNKLQMCWKILIRFYQAQHGKVMHLAVPFSAQV